MLHEMPNITIHLTRRHENDDLSNRSLRPGDGSVRPSRCAADSTVQDYHQAVFTRPLNTIADPAPSPIAMLAQHQLHFLRP
jgi:hypothetical protein